MGYSGAWGTLIYEKNLKAKISCQTPFKTAFFDVECATKNSEVGYDIMLQPMWRYSHCKLVATSHNPPVIRATVAAVGVSSHRQ